MSHGTSASRTESSSSLTSPSTILIVDDEQQLVNLVAGYLQREGFRVLRAYDGASALEIARSQSPDLLVLDLMLPGIDGFEVLRQFRQFSDAYVIMLTARSDEIDRVVGLTIGADDYLTKPFSPRELVARVRAMLRRPRSDGQAADTPEPPLPIKLHDIVVDLASHEVLRDGDPVSLTPIEFNLLATLASHPGMVFTRAQLVDRVWGRDFYGDEHVVDVHLSNLRRKLEPDPTNPRYLETIRGVGYRFRRPEL